MADRLGAHRLQIGWKSGHGWCWRFLTTVDLELSAAGYVALEPIMRMTLERDPPAPFRAAPGAFLGMRPMTSSRARGSVAKSRLSGRLVLGKDRWCLTPCHVASLTNPRVRLVIPPPVTLFCTPRCLTPNLGVYSAACRICIAARRSGVVASRVTVQRS